MKGWAELKEAFWAAVDAGPSEHARHVAALAAVDPELADRLEALLTADARSESLEQIFEAGSDPESSKYPLRIGAYEVTGVLGVGGMGEVYRARDVRLNREVAIKVLPAAVTGNPERLKRFEREAQLLASLNHPNIAQLYGLDESGTTPALVMELVEGPTLDAVTGQNGEGSIPLPRAFEIARQIANGLEAAHEKAIIHCDLKPGNVALTKKGDVKILDFGIAKTLERASPLDAAPLVSVDVDDGIVGTPAYMSPEQARGSTVDQRTDIWAFGCLLYELLTGRQPFAGVTASDSLAAVLERDPDMASLPRGTPVAVRSILQQCLQKDPSRRLQDIAAARRVMDDVLSGALAEDRAGRERRTRALVVAVPVLAIAVFLVAYWWRRSPQDKQLQAVPLTSLSGVVSSPSLSPDGTHVVFSWTGPKQDSRDLYVQQIGADAPRRLTTDPGGDYHPTWSPDGRTIAFLRRRFIGPTSEVRLISAAGGAERKLADIQPGLPFGGLTSLAWCPDATCILVTDSVGAGRSDALFAVPVDRRQKWQVTFPVGLVADVEPAVSPDGRSLIFRRLSAPFTGAFHRLALNSKAVPQGEPKRLTSGLSAGSSAWTLDGREIVFSARRALWRLDALTGGTPERLPFVGQDGQSPIIARTANGGQRLVYIRSVSDSNVWRLTTSARGVPASAAPVRAIASTRDDFTPILSPDDRRVAFWSNRSGEPQIWTAEIDGSEGRQLTSIAFRSFPAWPRWSPDGRLIAFQGDPQDRPDVLLVRADGGVPRILTANLFGAAFPSFSRDGRSLYLCRWDGPETRVWKMPVNGGRPVRITRNPGFVPIESRDGRDLYYVSAADGPGALWRMPTSGGAPVKLFDGVLFGNFDVIEQGVYYLERVPGDQGGGRPGVSPTTAIGEIRLQYFDFSTRRSTTIAQNLGAAGHGLTVSRDGRSIFFARIDSAIDELMLVDDFR